MFSVHAHAVASTVHIHVLVPLHMSIPIDYTASEIGIAGAVWLYTH